MSTLQRLALAVIMVFAFPLGALSAATSSGAAAVANTTGTISGQFLTTGGDPLGGGMVYFFKVSVSPPPSYEKYWRVPDFMKRLDNEGKFVVILPEGEYYMGAIKRLSGMAVGPPLEGDYFFISAGDNNVPLTYSVKNNARVDFGRIAKASPFKRITVNYGIGITAIEGIILDGEGKAVEGAYVFAFASPATVGRPLLASDPTSKDGRFILRVHDSGTYYLKARSAYGGGPPVPGESVGEKEPMAVTVNKGERLGGFVLKMRKFAGRGPQAGKK